MSFEPRIRYTIAIAAALAALAHAADLAAMVVAQRDFPDLVHGAEQIVDGTVVDVREARIDGVPVTLVTVSDLTVMKGAAEESLTLEIYGGREGEYAVRVPDMPVFRAGERFVLFVAGNGKNVCPLVGVWQGAFRVERAEGGGEIITTYDRTPIAGIAGGEIRRSASSGDGGGASTGLTLDDFRQLIADELVRGGAR